MMRLPLAHCALVYVATLGILILLTGLALRSAPSLPGLPF